MEAVIKVDQRNGVDVVESRIVAKGLGIKHKNLLETIKKHQSNIEAQFGRIAFETLNVLVPIPNTTTNRIDAVTVAFLTEDQFIFISTLSRNTQQVVEFKAKLVKAYRASKAPQVLPKSQSELILMIAQQNVLTEQRLKAIEEKVNEVAAKQTTTPSDYYAISGYARLLKVPLDLKIAQKLGIKCKKICSEMGFYTHKTHDPKFGEVGTYPKQVLETVFNQFYPWNTTNTATPNW